MEKIRNKEYELKDLAIGDRFLLDKNSKTVYELISFREKKRFPKNFIEKVIVENSETKSQTLKDPLLMAIFLRSK